MSASHLNQCITILSKRAANQEVPNSEVMSSMNSLQQILIPKHQSLFLPHLNSILDALLIICDDKDVSVRHTASVVLNSSVTVILPYQKSVILSFLAERCKLAFKAHALVEMLSIETKVTLFLTQKVARQLFSESSLLFRYCAKSSSEIVAEGMFNLAPKIRRFFVDRGQRLKLIKAFAKKKESVLSERWAIKSAAIFADPDLVDECVDLMSNKLEFLAAVPTNVVPKTLPKDAPLDQLIPFVERDPRRFFKVLKKPPSDPRSLSAFFSCLKYAIPYGYEPKFPLSVFSSMDNAGDPTIFSQQIECFAMIALRGVFKHSFIYQVFRDAIRMKNASCVASLSIVFNRYPSVQLFEEVMQIPTSSPTMCKSLILFFTEVDFDSLLESSRLLKMAIEKLVAISHSSHEMVQNYLLERLGKFNGGKTYPLFVKLFLDLDLFEPRAFHHGITLLAELATLECREEVTTLFLQLSEMDQNLLWGDASSLNVLMAAVQKLCVNCPRIVIPQFFAQLPLLVLRAIIAVLSGEWDEVLPKYPHYNQLLDSVKKSELLKSVILKQPLTSLLEIRDIAASCAASIRRLSKIYDDKTLDLIGRKLIPWPSKSVWLLITSSAKQLISTTGGALSLDPQIALAAALKCKEKFTQSMISDDIELKAFALCNNMDVEFDLSPELVEIVDRISSPLPSKIADILEGHWLVVFISKQLNHTVVQHFCEKPYEEWEGPREFWARLPVFLFLMKRHNGWCPQFDPEKCDSFHQFFANRHIRAFKHEPVADYGEIEMKVSKPEPKSERMEVSDYYDAEMIRGMRNGLYKTLCCSTFCELMEASTKPLTCPAGLFSSLISFTRSENCTVDTLGELLMFALEISVVEKNDDQIKMLQNTLNMAPFRGYAYQYFEQCESRGVTFEFPYISIDRVCLESEMCRIFPVCTRLNRKVKFPVQPISHFAMNMMANMIPQPFGICCRYLTCPEYNPINEGKLLRQIDQFGVTRFVAMTISNWVKDHKLLQVVNASLNYAASNGTYYTQMLAQAMGKAMRADKSVIPVVEAFVLALENTPLRKALETEFRATGKKQPK